MASGIEKFRQTARQMRSGKGRSARYPAAARSWAVQYAEAQVAKGHRVSAVAARLGISDMTLRSWLYGASQQSAGPLREVVVVEPVAEGVGTSRGITVTTAAGHVVGGLDLDGAAALLRALA